MTASVRTDRQFLSASIAKSRSGKSQLSAVDHAVRVIHRVCCLAGSADLLQQIRHRNSGPALRSAINAMTPLYCTIT